MPNSRLTGSRYQLLLLGLTCFLLINLFEAAQQYYYITRFQLTQEPISFWVLLQNHVIRWCIWSLTAYFFYTFVIRNPIKPHNFNLAFIGKYAGMTLLFLLLTLSIISFLQLLLNGDTFSLPFFFDYFQFFIYQKAALFVSAYIILVILIHLYLHQNELELKVMELSDLKKQHQERYQALKKQAFQDNTPLIHVKIGDKLKAIPLSDITWIQSDDYCVRIHTKHQKSYLLRKSMKALEKELTSKGFIRIHRNSIVNLAAVDSFIFKDHPQAQLKHGNSLKIANSRIPQIKELLKLE